MVPSDIVMPGTVNGIALANRRREIAPTLPVVLMTGYAAEIGKARDLGCVVLPKPSTPAVLVETLLAGIARCRDEARHGPAAA